MGLPPETVDSSLETVLETVELLLETVETVETVEVEFRERIVLLNGLYGLWEKLNGLWDGL